MLIELTTAVYLIIIIVLLATIAYFLFHKKTGNTKKIAKELFSAKKRLKKKTLVHNIVLYEAFFVIGVTVSIIGYLSSNWYIIIIGILTMLLSLPLLETVLRKRLEEDPEMAIVNKADELIKREKRVAKKEHSIRKQIDELYNKAIRLMAMEKEVKELRKRSALPEEDVKRVLRITDELLEKLPDEEIERFLKSADFRLYQKVMKRVK